VNQQLDPTDGIPDPDVVRQHLADSVRRCDLLRGLLRVALRKAAYRQPDDAAADSPQGGKAVRRG
jgi:hypothetical protein